MNIHFENFKGLRKCLQPVLELNKWRQKKLLRGNDTNEYICSCSICELNEQEESVLTHSPWVIFWACVVLGLCLVASCSRAYAFSDEAYVNAIYLAEGGSHVQFPYGIRSVNCSTPELCRHICKVTVQHNRRRFKEYGYRIYPEFIQFLASRYCPTTGRNLKTCERVLNKNWLKNVEYFLRKDKLK